MGFFRFLGKVAGVLFAALFIVTLTATLWAYNAQQTLLDRDTYDRIISNESLYDIFLPSLIPQLIEEVGQTPDLSSDAQVASQVFANLSEEDWQAITGLIAPAEWLHDLIASNVDSVFVWIDSQDVRPDIQIDLIELKTNLTGEEGREVVDLVVQSWAGCTDSEESQVESYLDGDSSSMPSCQPADDDLQASMIDDLHESVTATVKEIPDSISNSAPLSAEEQTEWLNIKLAIRVIQRASYLIFIIPVAFLLLIEIFAVRSLKEFFRWYGWAFFLGGLVSLLLLLPMAASPLAVWQFVSGRGQINPAMLPLIIGATNLMNRIARPLLFEGGGVMVVGVLFLAVGMSSLARRENDTDELTQSRRRSRSAA